MNMKQKKLVSRITAIVLAVVLVLGSTPFGALSVQAAQVYDSTQGYAFAAQEEDYGAQDDVQTDYPGYEADDETLNEYEYSYYNVNDVEENEYYTNENEEYIDEDEEYIDEDEEYIDEDEEYIDENDELADAYPTAERHTVTFYFGPGQVLLYQLCDSVILVTDYACDELPDQLIFFNVNTFASIRTNLYDEEVEVISITVFVDAGTVVGQNMPPEPRYDDYVFVGWNYAADGSDLFFDMYSYIFEDIILFAVFEAAAYVTAMVEYQRVPNPLPTLHLVTFNLNGGQVPFDQLPADVTMLSVSDHLRLQADIAVFEREQHAAKLANLDFNDPWAVYHATVAIFGFEPGVPHVRTFVSMQNGNIDALTHRVEFGASLGNLMPPTPTMESDMDGMEFMFVGWNTQPDGSGIPMGSGSVVHYNVALYAIFYLVPSPEPAQGIGIMAMAGAFNEYGFIEIAPLSTVYTTINFIVNGAQVHTATFSGVMPPAGAFPAPPVVPGWIFNGWAHCRPKATCCCDMITSWHNLESKWSAYEQAIVNLHGQTFNAYAMFTPHLLGAQIRFYVRGEYYQTSTVVSYYLCCCGPSHWLTAAQIPDAPPVPPNHVFIGWSGNINDLYRANLYRYLPGNSLQSWRPWLNRVYNTIHNFYSYTSRWHYLNDFEVQTNNRVGELHAWIHPHSYVRFFVYPYDDPNVLIPHVSPWQTRPVPGWLGSMLMVPSPTLPSHHFTHWNTQPDGRGIRFLQTTIVVEPIDVFAQFGAQITFIAQNAANSTATRNVTRGLTVNEDVTASWPVFSWAGRTFTHWSSNPDGSGQQWTADCVFPGQMVIYGNWVINPPVTVTFVPSPGVPVAGHTYTRDAVRGLAGGIHASFAAPYNMNQSPQPLWPRSAPAINPPAGSSSTFAGWWAEPVGRGVFIAAPGGPSITNTTTDATHARVTHNESRNAYPLFTYTVTFNANGGGAVAARHIAYENIGGPFTLHAHTLSISSNVSRSFSRASGLPLTSRAGFIFDGWHTLNGTITGNWGDPFTADSIVNGNMTVFARWIQRFCYGSTTVTFDSNGGIFAGGVQTHTRYLHPNNTSFQTATTIRYDNILGANIPVQTADQRRQVIPALPTKPGYVFVGWYPFPHTGGTRLQFNSIVPWQPTTTCACEFCVGCGNFPTRMYARWAPAVPIHINFNGANPYRSPLLGNASPGGTPPGTPYGSNTTTRYYVAGMSVVQLANIWRTSTGRLDECVPLHMPVYLWPDGSFAPNNNVNRSGFGSTNTNNATQTRVQMGAFDTQPDGLGAAFTSNTVVTQAMYNTTVYAVRAARIRFHHNFASIGWAGTNPAIADRFIIQGKSFRDRAISTGTANSTLPDINNIRAGTGHQITNPCATFMPWVAPALTGVTSGFPVAGLHFPGYNNVWPTATGWTEHNLAFIGWNIDPGATLLTTTGWFTVYCEAVENKDLFAIWADGIFFNLGAAEGFAPPIPDEHQRRQFATVGDSIDVDRYGRAWPPDPVWYGNIFAGWNTAANRTGTTYSLAVGTIPSTTFTIGRTLIAQWDGAVFFVPRLGEFFGVPAGQETTPVYRRLPLRQPIHNILPPPDPIRPNWTFHHWNSMADGTGTVFVPYPQGHTGLITGGNQYARWQARVTFELDGGQIGTSLVNPLVMVPEYQNLVGRTPAANPTRFGYTFVRWELICGTEFDPAAPVTNGHFTVYARYTELMQLIQFAAGPGGALRPATGSNLNIQQGQSITNPALVPAPEASTGFEFSHWVANCPTFVGVTFADAAAIAVAMITNPTTFTAHFTLICPLITIDVSQDRNRNPDVTAPGRPYTIGRNIDNNHTVTFPPGTYHGDITVNLPNDNWNYTIEDCLATDVVIVTIIPPPASGSIVIQVDPDRDTSVTGTPDYEIEGDNPGDTGDIVVTFPPGTDSDDIVLYLPDGWEYDIYDCGTSGEVIVTITPPYVVINVSLDRNRNPDVTAPRDDYEIDKDGDDNHTVILPPGTNHDHITVNLPNDNWSYTIHDCPVTDEVIVTIIPPPESDRIVVTVDDDRTTGVTGAPDYEIEGDNPSDTGDIIVTFPPGIDPDDIVLYLPSDDWEYDIYVCNITDEVIVTIIPPYVIIDVSRDRNRNPDVTAPRDDYEIDKDGDDNHIVILPPGTYHNIITVNLPSDTWSYTIHDCPVTDEVIVTIIPPPESDRIVVTVDDDRTTGVTGAPDYEIEGDDPGSSCPIVVTFPPGTDQDDIVVYLPEGWTYDVETCDTSGEVVVTLTPPSDNQEVTVDDDGNVVVVVPPYVEYYGPYDNDDGTITVTFPPQENIEDEDCIVINLPPGWTYETETGDDGTIHVIITPPSYEVVIPDYTGEGSTVYGNRDGDASRPYDPLDEYHPDNQDGSLTITFPIRRGARPRDIAVDYDPDYWYLCQDTGIVFDVDEDGNDIAIVTLVPNAILYGYVFRTGTTIPIRGATVRLYSNPIIATTITDAAGRFDFTNYTYYHNGELRFVRNRIADSLVIKVDARGLTGFTDDDSYAVTVQRGVNNEAVLFLTPPPSGPGPGDDDTGGGTPGGGGITTPPNNVTPPATTPGYNVDIPGNVDNPGDITVNDNAADGNLQDNNLVVVFPVDPGTDIADIDVNFNPDYWVLESIEIVDGYAIVILVPVLQTLMDAIDATPVSPIHHAYIIGFEDGTVRPNANLSRAQAATIFFRLIDDNHRISIWSQENSFSDVHLNGWYNNAISTLSNGGIIHGFPDGTFMPNQNITRAEFTAMLVRFMGFGHVTGMPSAFTDTEGHWAQEFINTAHAQNWIQGFGNSTFRPDQPITRAEVAAIVNRALGRLPETTADLLPGMITWSDNMNTSAWYYLYIQEATNTNYHEMKADGIHKTWVQLVDPRDWTVLERPTSRPQDILR